MKKLLLAAAIALPFLAATPQNASAQCCGCCSYSGGNGVLGSLACMRSKICTTMNAIGPCGSCGNIPWQGGPFSCLGCPGRIPGPWYQYWPNNGCMQGSGYTSGCGSSWWSLENHFVAPAPTGYPYYPPPMSMAGSSWAYPGGNCPSYWYGR